MKGSLKKVVFTGKVLNIPHLTEKHVLSTLFIVYSTKLGKIVFNNGIIYEGELKNDLPNG